MNITAIRVGRTFNLGNYESRKVEIEAIPANGQTFEEAMAEVNALVEAQGQAEEKGATTKPKPAPKPVNSTPPLANKGAKPESTDPTMATSSPTAPTTQTVAPANPATPGIEPPFEPGSNVVAEPAKKRGRPRKAAAVPEHEKELQYVLDSENLDELFQRFCKLRTYADAFGGIENWAAACRKVQERYKALNSPIADPALQKSITDALVSESTAIAEARKANAA